MRLIHYATFTAGLLWLGLVICYPFSSLIARDIRPIGALARMLDNLPPTIGHAIFAFLWLVFLLGWIAPVAVGARPLFRRVTH